MSGHWDDVDADNLDAEDFEAGDFDPETLDPEFQAQLAEVAAFLASVPDPVLPPGIEARIAAAIVAAPESPGTRSAVTELSVFARRSRWHRPRPGKVLAPVAACLVLAVAGYFISLAHDSSRSGPTASAAAGSSSASVAASAEGARPAASAPSLQYGQTSGERNESAASEEPTAAGTAGTAFGVISSGTQYGAATLAAQARGELSVGAGATALASGTLLGCVNHLTGGAPPRLVDRATYQGTPAYVIVGESKVWVVGLGCTASHPELVASAVLAG